VSFLVPDASEVVARSPMERRARDAGARFEVRDGWNVAVSFPGESGVALGFADRSHLRRLDGTCAYAAIALLGPAWPELLGRFCAIDVRALPIGELTPGSVARTPGYLLREPEDRLLVFVGWALGEYLWEVVADAAAHLGGGPVGADALA
jgi:sarcosine oxidase gamma subunit